MISPIEGQKSNFLVCYFKSFHLVSYHFIKNNGLFSWPIHFLVSLLFISWNKRVLKSYSCGWLKRIQRYCSAKNNFFSHLCTLLPQENPSPPKQLLKIHFLFSVNCSLETYLEKFHCHCFLFPNSIWLPKGLFPLFLDEHCWSWNGLGHMAEVMPFIK